MAELLLNQTVETEASFLSLEGLPVGRHVFELQVEDESGNVSQPTRVVVQVRASAPRITSFDPEFGPTGERVILWASGLVSQNHAADHEVLFNGVKARITGGSTRTLHALVPEGATSGQVTLITSRGQGVSDVPFHIPRRRLLLLPGAHSPCFAPGDRSVAALAPDGRLAMWNLKNIALTAARIEPGARDPAFSTGQPDAMVDLGGQASKLLWLSSPEFSGFLAWHPASTEALLVVPGEARARTMSLPGEPLDIQAPAPGRGRGMVGLFLDANGRVGAAHLSRGGSWEPLHASEPRHIGLSPDGQRLGIFSKGGALTLWELPDGKLVDGVPLSGGPTVSRLLFGDEGGLWVLAEKPARVYHLRQGHLGALDLGFAPESAALQPGGMQLFCSGKEKPGLLAIRAPGPMESPDRLFGRVLALPHPGEGEHALAATGQPDRGHVVTLHTKERSLSFVHGRTLERTVTLPLESLGGTGFAGGGKARVLAASPEGGLCAIALEEGLGVLDVGSVLQ